MTVITTNALPANQQIVLANGLPTPAFSFYLQQLLTDILAVNGLVTTGSNGRLVGTTATDGQIAIGATGSSPAISTITPAIGITVTNGPGSITITNSGVTSIAGTANQILASAATGAVVLSLPTVLIAPGSVSATTYDVRGDSPPVLPQNGLYLSAVNQLAFSAETTYCAQFSGGSQNFMLGGTSSDTDTGQKLQVSGDVQFRNTGATGESLSLLGNGASTPSKTIRVHSGVLQFLNDAVSTVIASLTDLGAFTVKASINNVAITVPATLATLTLGSGKTLTVSSSLTLTGTDSTTMTFPSTSATLARTDASQTFTGLQIFDDQIESFVAPGTAPFVVASTTNVANLNASSLNGATFAAPGAIGYGTASTGAFTTLASSGAFGCNGAAPQTSYALPPTATDLPTAIARINAVCALLIANGQGS